MRRGLLVPAVLALSSGACSLFVQPDESQLVPPDGAAVTDSGPRPDALDAQPGVDVPVTGRDVPVGNDVQPACPAGCDDGVPCTVDACNAATATCTHTADSSMCGARMICDPHMGCIVHECAVDADCSDANVCNGVERCAAAHCVAGTAMVCDDGQFCDGAEACDPAAGCTHGAAPACDDGNACTSDRCDPTANSGHGACASAAIPGCVAPPPNDTCATATPITLGLGAATVTGTTVDAGDGVDSTCGARGAGDVWYAVTYPADADLRVETNASTTAGDTVLVARAGCTTEDLVCNDDIGHTNQDSRLWIRSSTAPPSTGAMRTVYIVVDAYMPGAESAFSLTVTATAPLDSTTCAAGGFDVTEGGTVAGELGRAAGAFSGMCGGAGSGSEDIYHYGAPGGTAVEDTLHGTGFTPVIYARGGICQFGTELRCASGNPAVLDYNQGPSGTSFVFVDGSMTGSLSPYTLRIYGP